MRALLRLLFKQHQKTLYNVFYKDPFAHLVTLVAKKLLKRYLPTAEQIKENKSFGFMGELLHDPNLWHFNRRSVSGAFAAGLFSCYVPIPLQMLQAAILAVVFRVNLPLSVSLVWITNPITIPPMFYLAYKVGTFVLGTELQPFEFQFNLDWLFLELGHRWRPFLLGCLIMSTTLSITGFITVRLLWRLHLIQRIKERKVLQKKNKS